jgi:hypothetical protein
MSRVAADMPRSWGLYESLWERAEREDRELAGKPVHPGAAPWERERQIRLEQLRAGYPVEMSHMDLPEAARPGGKGYGCMKVVYPDGSITPLKRDRRDTGELLYEWAESDQYGTPADYARHLYGKYYGEGRENL